MRRLICAFIVRICHNIRIFNGCEVLTENSVTRVTVRHHEARPKNPKNCLIIMHQSVVVGIAGE